MTPEIRWAILWIAIVSFFVADLTLANPCQAAGSCTECVRVNADCSWCTDAAFNGTSRCDLRSTLNRLCAVGHQYAPEKEVRLPKQHNIPLGKKRGDDKTVTQLEPQHVQIRLKPGDSVEVPFRYEHRQPLNVEVRNFEVMMSSVKGTSVEAEFAIDCNGERKTGSMVCPGIQNGQRVNFYLKLTLIKCQSAAISVSVYGHNTVSGVFVTPLCDCDCERPHLTERRSSSCGGDGDLQCGQCKCAPGKGGKQCECDLRSLGISTADQLENQCRKENGKAVCSGNGWCECGKCRCANSTIQGDYCECDNTQCPKDEDGRLCSAQGECRCGKCDCEPGFTGPACGCKDDPEPCTENGLICSGNGRCECGVCACNLGFTGQMCAVEQSPSEWGEILPVGSAEESQSHADAHQNTASASIRSLLPLIPLFSLTRFLL